MEERAYSRALEDYVKSVDPTIREYQARYGEGAKPSEDYLRAYGFVAPEKKQFRRDPYTGIMNRRG
jgi:hypothetical protein